jgi:hypothetical protein
LRRTDRLNDLPERAGRHGGDPYQSLCDKRRAPSFRVGGDVRFRPIRSSWVRRIPDHHADCDPVAQDHGQRDERLSAIGGCSVHGATGQVIAAGWATRCVFSQRTISPRSVPI